MNILWIASVIFIRRLTDFEKCYLIDPEHAAAVKLKLLSGDRPTDRKRLKREDQAQLPSVVADRISQCLVLCKNRLMIIYYDNRYLFLSKFGFYLFE